MIKDKIIKTARRLIRSVEYENQLDTLFFFLNSYADVRKVPKATGELRKLQMCDYKLLKIFHAVCEKNGLKYWLDGGTMLGAYRHQGFIPWDDDMDVCMTREDYDKALVLFKDELGKYGINATEGPGRPGESMGIGYKHVETGIWLDVYPFDIINQVSLDESNKKLLEKKVEQFRKYYRRAKKSKARSELAKRRDKLLKSINPGSGTIFCHGPEFIYYKLVVYDEEMVLPLKKMKFEGDEFWCPNDPDRYLAIIYGENYMCFPRSGVLHHGKDSEKLYERANNNGLDLSIVEQELDEIYTKIMSK